MMEIPIEVQKMLGPKEKIELFVNEESHPEITIDSSAITNERLLFRRNGADSKDDFKAYAFSDIVGVGMEKGFMRSIIRLRLKSEATVLTIRMPTKLAEQAMVSLKQKVCGIVSPFA
jgi:hypothetical protein